MSKSTHQQQIKMCEISLLKWEYHPKRKSTLVRSYFEFTELSFEIDNYDFEDEWTEKRPYRECKNRVENIIIRCEFVRWVWLPVVNNTAIKRKLLFIYYLFTMSPFVRFRCITMIQDKRFRWCMTSKRTQGRSDVIWGESLRQSQNTGILITRVGNWR